MSDALMDAVCDWGIVGNIKAISFDTTSSNTEKRIGACTLFQQRVGRNVLHLVYRHHIHEIMLEEAFSITMGPSSGPDILIFKRFKAFWPNIVYSDYKPGNEVLELLNALADMLDDMKTFLTGQLEMSHQREDYRELLELALLFTGGIPTRGLIFRKPGIIRRARFMAMLIYALKMYIVRDSGFKMTAGKLRGLGEFCVFGVAVYIKSWFLCRRTTVAPANDLQLLKCWTSSESQASLGALRCCWAFVVFKLRADCTSLFCLDVDAIEKRTVVERLGYKETDDPLKRITVKRSEITKKQLHDFVTQNTKNFRILSIPDSFLSADAEIWPINEAYLEAESVVKELHAVNDTAEGGVALMNDYNALVTKDEEQINLLCK